MTRNLLSTIVFLGTSAALALSLSACGGGHEAGSGRPTTDQIVTSLTSGAAADSLDLTSDDVPKSAFQCIAQKFEDSKLSDAALRSIINGDTSYKATKADTDALTDIEKQMTDCVTAG